MAAKKPVEDNGYRTIYIPKESREDTERFLTVNGDSILVQTGISVQVPAKFAALWEDNMRTKEKAERYIEANAKD